jgi:hypothetical protein
VVIDSSDNIPLGVKEVAAKDLQSRFEKYGSLLYPVLNEV